MKKVCSRCNKEKNCSDFPIQRRKGKEFRRSECRECYNSYFRNYMKGNKTHVARVKKVKEQRRKEVCEYKLTKGCEICGYNKTYWALEFHHRNPEEKKYNISSGMSDALKFDDLLEEINKCAVLCSNCHREVEAGITQLPEQQ